MIEVEQKFILSDAERERLLSGARFLEERRFTDTYYDTEDYALTTADRWLRARNGTFELKIPLEAKSNHPTDQYREIDRESEIRAALRLEETGTFPEALARAGCSPCATIGTVRQRYEKENFMIDLDEADFGYAIAEVELLVPETSGVAKGLEALKAFAERHGLVLGSVRGKLIEYLRRERPAHYRALVEAHVINPLYHHGTF